MEPITDETHAARLARAILADIALYETNSIREARISVRRAIGTQIEEGRGLFNARVAEQCSGVFERELIPWLAALRPDLADEPGFIPQRETSPRNAEENSAREGERIDPRLRDTSKPVIIATIVLAVATGVFWFLRH